MIFKREAKRTPISEKVENFHPKFDLESPECYLCLLKIKK
jgi:hypothetical protein